MGSCWCLLWVLAWPCAYAHAGQPPESSVERARAYYKGGLAEYTAGHYADAVAAFEKGYAITKRPLFLYNIAQAERAAGHVDVALRYYRQYMTDESDASAPEIATAARWVNVLSHGASASGPTPEPQLSATTPPVSPDAAAAPTPLLAVVPPASVEPRRHSHVKRALLWTGLSVVIVGAALGVGLGLGLRRSPPHTTLDPVAF